MPSSHTLSAEPVAMPTVMSPDDLASLVRDLRFIPLTLESHLPGKPRVLHANSLYSVTANVLNYSLDYSPDYSLDTLDTLDCSLDYYFDYSLDYSLDHPLDNSLDFSLDL
jgi:hypothetical protein